MKKIVALLLGAMTMLSLNACSERAEENTGIPIPEQTSTNGQSAIDQQLEIIAENRALWTQDLEYADEVYQYAVADLDHNGRCEVIASNMGGTGLYTYTRFFEVNENYDGLVECKTDFKEGDSQPDFISDTLECYMDGEGNSYYAVYDFMRNGAAESYENVRSLTLQEGEITTASIASKTIFYDEDGNPTITCTDGTGREMTEAQYDAAVEQYFENFKPGVTKLGWQNVRELPEDTKDVVMQLKRSWNVFA